jgi:hypothetical protein
VLWICPVHHKALHRHGRLDLKPGVPAGLAGVPPKPWD